MRPHIFLLSSGPDKVCFESSSVFPFRWCSRVPFISVNGEAAPIVGHCFLVVVFFFFISGSSATKTWDFPRAAGCAKTDDSQFRTLCVQIHQIWSRVIQWWCCRGWSLNDLYLKPKLICPSSSLSTLTVFLLDAPAWTTRIPPCHLKGMPHQWDSESWILFTDLTWIVSSLLRLYSLPCPVPTPTRSDSSSLSLGAVTHCTVRVPISTGDLQAWLEITALLESCLSVGLSVVDLVSSSV